jgi:glycosyltransferase involved in cell wall biosynthesis
MKINSNHKIKISVLMAAYNEEKRISDCIDSILNQTYTNFEFIIVDDGSTDHTPEVLKQYAKKDKRIKIFTKTNTGLTKSLNYGLKFCDGKYIARMDANDVALPERFMKQLNFLEHNKNYAVIGCWREEFWDDGKIRKIQLPVTDKEIQRTLIKTPCLGHSTSMIVGNVLRQIRYNEKFKYSQDQVLWANIGKYYKLANLPEYLMRISRFDGSITHSRNQFKDLSNQIKIKWLAYKNLKCSPWAIIYVLSPLVIALTPKKVLNWYINLKKNVEVK